jgi:hypothetical protein
MCIDYDIVKDVKNTLELAVHTPLINGNWWFITLERGKETRADVVVDGDFESYEIEAFDSKHTLIERVRADFTCAKDLIEYCYKQLTEEGIIK